MVEKHKSNLSKLYNLMSTALVSQCSCSQGKAWLCCAHLSGNRKRPGFSGAASAMWAQVPGTVCNAVSDPNRL